MQIMPKRRDGIMTVRIPTDEKDVLQAIADHLDLTLSDVVVQAVRAFVASNKGALKKSPAKPAAKVAAKSAGKAKSR